MQKEELIKELEKRWVSRVEIREMTGLPDAQARGLLAEIRKEKPVINFQDNKGYHISYDANDINRMIAQEKARANKIYQNVKVLDYWAGRSARNEMSEDKCFELIKGMMGV